ncbi:hypothetical protein [Belliella baltica]|uniref:hypothetical protein n=1 Tax=Belliella baltica TaxID=232259 RepID=UPI00030E6A8D|nr:hypothetical protein [Belliella baltica]
MDDNSLDFNLAMSVGDFFRLDKNQMNRIIDEILDKVKKWEKIAYKIGISRSDKEIMRNAFRF